MDSRERRFQSGRRGSHAAYKCKKCGTLVVTHNGRDPERCARCHCRKLVRVE